MYTTAGCRVPVETPKRKQVGRPVPLLIRPLKPPFPDNPEHLLHAAIQRGKQPDVVICLVEAYPEAAKVPNQYNMLPLHLAMIDGATGPMIDVRPSEQSAASSRSRHHGAWQALIKAPGGGEHRERPRRSAAAHLLQNGGVGTFRRRSRRRSSTPTQRRSEDGQPGEVSVTRRCSRCGWTPHPARLGARAEGQSPAAVLSPDGDLPTWRENEVLETVRAIVKSFRKGSSGVTTATTSTLHRPALANKLKPRRIEERARSRHLRGDARSTTDPELSTLVKRSGRAAAAHVPQLALRRCGRDAHRQGHAPGGHPAEGAARGIQQAASRHARRPAICLMLERNRGRSHRRSAGPVRRKTLIATKNGGQRRWRWS